MSVTISHEDVADLCTGSVFLATGGGERFAQAVIAESTGCKAVASHRGYLSVKGRFGGVPGHSSEPRALTDNALHKLSGWVAAAVERAAQMALTQDQDVVQTLSSQAAEPALADSVGLGCLVGSAQHLDRHCRSDSVALIP